MNSREMSSTEILLQEVLETVDPGELFEENPDKLLVQDEENECEPSDLGKLLELARDTSFPLQLKTDVDWSPGDVRPLTEYFEGDVPGKVESLLRELLYFEEGDTHDSIRSLMQTCDELMESLTSEPEAVEELDSRL